MNAVVVEKHGGPEVLQYKQVPIPKADQKNLVIRNHIIGVNYIDTYHRSGLYPLPTPLVVGKESAGEVVEVGPGVTNFKVGDRVVYLGGDTYAEYSKAEPISVVKLSDNVSYETAAASVLQGLTAWTMVRDGYPVKKGDYILVHAAAGGVGLLLCQMCKHLGAHVIGTVSSNEKAKIALENGAEFVINTNEENTVERVNEITGGLGCHAVLDGVGKATFSDSLEAVRRLGTVISFGNASGTVPPINIAILSKKNVKLMRPALYNYLGSREEVNKWFGELWELLEAGHIKIHIHKIYDLKDAKQAHLDIESRKTTGKLLLKA
ncbi:hypothetical protein PHYBLDRAFT_146839 [Phycomyces blakesleeanus NRRL 1555(-)]|nr:hypothetical protein PHYBLDRAFT_146839 [Phycomyces blakesleeanus NRRL 1555(-)]OAD71859.1 hypothetical protein PHYBLDRAFT_146839 [Phycomyces blakesleeanus NRRL 1555(-)]|eukprot:XP_018289899.1 hypothetical protein PHYBLDRAFT_146839 [Phycomyces blakesleeanus NRRL 1555(-)]